MDFYRAFEVVLYSLFDFLPYMAIAVYPFCKQPRFSLRITYIMLAVATALRIATDLLSVAFPDFFDGFGFIKLSVFALFYFLALDVRIGKLLFMGFMILNVGNFIEVSAKCIEIAVFGAGKAAAPFSLTYSVIMIILELLFVFPLYCYFKVYYRRVFEKNGATSLWHYLWLIPASFGVIWYFHMYSTHSEGSNGGTLGVAQAVFLLLINISAVVFYHFISLLIDETDKNERLTESNYQLVMQKLQYDNLKDRINEARQAKHDIRHHITVMDGYLQRGEYYKLRQYFKLYNRSLPDDTVINFCSNSAINALLLFFAQQAKNEGVDFDVAVSFPEVIDIPEDMLSVVFGNLIENAVQAAASSGLEVPRIIIRGRVEGDALFIKIKNSYSGELKRDKNGCYLSTKKEGKGIGLESVRNIIRQRDGMMDITGENGMFCVSALLKLGRTEGERV